MTAARAALIRECLWYSVNCHEKAENIRQKGQECKKKRKYLSHKTRNDYTPKTKTKTKRNFSGKNVFFSFQLNAKHSCKKKKKTGKFMYFIQFGKRSCLYKQGEPCFTIIFRCC